MNDSAPNTVRCPRCGAENESGYTLCWLCLPSPDEVLDTSRPATLRETNGEKSAATSLLAIIVLAVVTIGLFQTAPGLAILLLLVGVPAVLVASLRQRKSQSTASTISYQIHGYLASTLTVLGVIAMVAVAVVIAFGAFCFVICQIA